MLTPTGVSMQGGKRMNLTKSLIAERSGLRFDTKGS